MHFLYREVPFCRLQTLLSAASSSLSALRPFYSPSGSFATSHWIFFFNDLLSAVRVFSSAVEVIRWSENTREYFGTKVTTWPSVGFLPVPFQSA